MVPGNRARREAAGWLPAEQLGQWPVDALLRPWLIAKGLLTLRLRAACGGRFELRLCDQHSGPLSMEHRRYLSSRDNAGLFREVQMSCGGLVWVFAQTIMPDSTLDAHPWLAELGEAALGETLADLSDVRRSSYEYAWLPADEPLAQRALRGVAPRPEGLWARRSRFWLRSAPFMVQELFLPAMGDCRGTPDGAAATLGG
ncbi:MAG TPA: chorismate lyase [Steroidobacteraceae bacterium]|nr:chorismate lyase [Steroidobacteraceae bacterium]